MQIDTGKEPCSKTKRDRWIGNALVRTASVNRMPLDTRQRGNDEINVRDAIAALVVRISIHEPLTQIVKSHTLKIGHHARRLVE